MSLRPALVVVFVSVLLTAAGAVLLLDVNRGLYLDLIYFDPQTDDEKRAYGRTTAIMTATSGFAFGQLVALVMGAWLTQSFRAPLRALILAVPTGVVLAVIDLTIAWSASTHLEDVSGEPAFRLAVGVGLIAFPLAAAAGVGLGAWSGRRLQVILMIVLPILVVLGYVGTAIGAITDTSPAVMLVLLTAVPPAAVTVALAQVGVEGYGVEFAVAALVGCLAWPAVLLVGGWRAHRRRTTAPGPASDAGEGPGPRAEGPTT
jgi:hypothetical protein